MKKSLLFFLSFFIFLQAKELTSLYTLKTNGDIIDMILNSGKIYATTDSSSVDIFDIKTKKLEKVIKFKKMKDFLGDLSDIRIYSVDKINNKLLFATQGEEGYSRIYIYENGKKKLIFDKKNKMPILKAGFISENKIIFATLSSEVALYNLKTKKFIYIKQISGSKFSDFALNRAKTKMVLVDESGNAKLINISNGKIIRIFKGQNLDNVYQVDYKNHIIATAGKDRRCVVYKDNGSYAYYKTSNFLIYSVGLSPNGKLCGYSSDEKNNITIFNTQTQENLYKLIGDKSPISNIIFINENTLFTSSKNKIKFWRLR